MGVFPFRRLLLVVHKLEPQYRLSELSLGFPFLFSAVYSKLCFIFPSFDDRWIVFREEEHLHKSSRDSEIRTDSSFVGLEYIIRGGSRCVPLIFPCCT